MRRPLPVQIKQAAAGAFIAALVFGPTQATENTAKTYRFENAYGAQVQCVVIRRNGVEQHQIITTYRSSEEYDQTPTAQAWASSGCAAYVKSRTRVLSAEEIRQREAASRAPARYYGPGGLREEIVELMCRDPKNAGSEECIKWAAR